jgi:large subunit ribosomal protein L10
LFELIEQRAATDSIRRSIELNRNDKAGIIERLRESLADVPAILVTDFKGLDVENATALRDKLREADITYEVVKNTLAKKAVEGTSKENLSELFKGNSAIAYHAEDPSAPAKVLTDYAKDNENLILKGAWLDGNLLDIEGVKVLAKLPGKDELRARLLSVFIGAPTKLVRTLVAAPTQFVQVLRAREQQLAE